MTKKYSFINIVKKYWNHFAQIWDFAQNFEKSKLVGVRLHPWCRQLPHHCFAYFDILQKIKIKQVGFRLFHNIFYLLINLKPAIERPAMA